MHARLSVLVVILAFTAFVPAAASAGAGELGVLRAPEVFSWSADRRLTRDPAASEVTFNFARSIAADGAGQVHVVWYDRRDGVPQIYYRRSPNGGRRWLPAVRLSGHPAGAEHPSIALSGVHVYVVWHDFRRGRPEVFLRRSADGGRTWRPAELLTPQAGASAHPSVAAAGSRVHVVWGDSRHGQAEIYVRSSADGGTTWRKERRLSSVPYESWVPAVAAAGRGVFVAWVDYRDGNEEEYFRRSTDGGVTWEQTERLTHDFADSWAPSLAVAGETLHLAWFDRRDAGLTDADVEAVLDRAMALVGLPAAPPPPRDPAVYYLPGFERRVQDKLELIRAAAPAWVARGGDPLRLESLLRDFERAMERWATGWEVYYKSSDDLGATWSADRRLTRAAKVSARPSIAAAGDDVHLVWYDSRHGAPEIYYAYSPNGGAAWWGERRLTRAGGASLRPSIAVRGRRVHVVWFDERPGNSEIYYKRGVLRSGE